MTEGLTGTNWSKLQVPIPETTEHQEFEVCGLTHEYPFDGGDTIWLLESLMETAKHTFMGFVTDVFGNWQPPVIAPLTTEQTVG